jgi:hypothetical protein
MGREDAAPGRGKRSRAGTRAPLSLSCEARQARGSIAQPYLAKWPGAGFDTRGPREDRADVLPLAALLHGDAMVAALMHEVERMSNTPVPQAERKMRIAKLEAELGKLAFIEEALVAAAIAEGEDVQRSTRLRHRPCSA